LPLSERARIEIYLPDFPAQSCQVLLDTLQQELTYTFGGCSVLRVLDQVSLPRAARARVGHELASAVELLVAREDQEALPGLAAPRVFLLHFVDELPHEVEDAVAQPGLLP
jgi:hypothetical protein